MVNSSPHPIRFSVEYPDRELDTATTLLRPIVAIPILIVLATVLGGGYEAGDEGQSVAAGAGGLLVLGPMLMILFRQKYPRWWFDWNVELLRFANRVFVYLALMDDRYPATDEHQSVRLEVPYPNVNQDLNRWLPLVKWFLAIPHVVALFVLGMGAMFAIVFAWFAILINGRYPQGLFGYVEGVLRWHNRVVGYALILTTDQYPPFSLTQGLSAPVPEQRVTVLMASLGDTMSPECTRVAILHASGDQETTDEGEMISKLREEAGKLGANTLFIQDLEEAGTGERIVGEVFGVESDRDAEAVALCCES